MIPSREKHHRRSIRLQDFDYSRPGVYSVTLCTWNREYLFGIIQDAKMLVNGAGEILDEMWRLLPGRFPGIILDEMTIMPNHIHGIIHITVGAKNVGAIHELPLQGSSQHKLPLHLQRRKMILPKVVGFFKMNAAKRINRLRQTPGNHVWQRNYYEHVIRNEKALNAIRRYIQYNPAMWPHDADNPDARHSLHDMPRNVLVQHYGFTDEELDFIINYDIKYRTEQDSLKNEEDSMDNS